MSIIETKLFKDRIETPELITNEILLNGRPVSDALFEGIVRTTLIDSREELRKLGNTPTHYAAQQVVGWKMQLGEQTHDYAIRQVTLRRCDTTGDAYALNNNVFMYIDCVNQEGTIIKTVYSLNSTRQVSGDNNQTTWTFPEDFILIPEYTELRFYFTSISGQRQTDKKVRSSYMKVGQNGGKLHVNGWQTLYPNNLGWKDFTTDFNIRCEKVYSGLQDHVRNDQIHLTPDFIERFNEVEQITKQNNFVSNISKQLLKIQTEQYSTLGEDYTVTDRGKSDAYAIELSKQHFTPNATSTTKYIIEKISLPFIGGNTDQSYMCVQFFNSQNNIIDTKFSSNTQVQSGNGINQFVFEKLVIPNNYTYARIYYTQNNTDVPVLGATRSQVVNCKKLRIRVLSLKTDDTNYTFDTDECQVISYENNTDDTASRKTYNNWRAKIDIQAIKYTNHFENLDIHVSTEQKNKWNSYQQSIQEAIQSRDEIQTHINDNDIHVIGEDKERWDIHTNNTDIHVTQDDKERWNNIEIPQPIVYTEGNNIAISNENVISVVTTDVLDNSDAIPTSKAVYDTFYEDKSFNNFNSSIYTAKADTVGTVVLSKKHFISGGRITKVSVPHGNTREDLDNGEGGYLVIEVFAEDTTQADGYDKTNPIHRYYADEYYAYKNRLNEGKYEWTFNNTECIIPKDYKVVHLSLVIQNTTIPAVGSNNNAKFRVNCLAKNDNKNEDVVFEEDDECRVYWKGNTNGGNYVAIVNVDYVVDKLDAANVTEIKNSLENHLNSDVHLTDTQKEAIDKVSTIETTINSHVGDDTHLTAEQKEDIARIDSIEANASLIAPLSIDFNNHINDDDIHFSQSLIMDGAKGQMEERTFDLSQGISQINAAQGIAYTQICAEHTLPSGSYLKTVTVPQNHDRTDYTNEEVYLVIYGDTTGSDSWDFITMSTNKCLQDAGGTDMVFTFPQDIDLGAYKKYRFFYVISNENVTPSLPTTGSAFNGVKMAFPSRRIDDNCMVMQTNGTWVSRYTFPAIITYEIYGEDIVPHKNNEDRHVTQQIKSDIASTISAFGDLSTSFESHINDSDIHVTLEEKDTLSRLAKQDLIAEVEEQVDLVRTTLDNHIGNFEEHMYQYGLHLTQTEKNFNNSITKIDTKISDIESVMSQYTTYELFSAFDNPNYVVHTDGRCTATCIQLSRRHFISGDIKFIEISHQDGNSTNGMRLCVIVYAEGEDENTEKTLTDCIFSSNTQNQSGAAGKMIFQFEKLTLPDNYAFVKLFFAKSTDTFPIHTDTNTVHTPRIQVLRNKSADNFNEYADDECKIYTNTGTANWYAAIGAGYLTYPFKNYKTLLDRIIALEARVNELENS